MFDGFNIKLIHIVVLVFFFSNYLIAKVGHTCGYVEKEYIQSRYITFDSSDKKPIFKDNIVKWYYNSIDYQGFSEFDKQEIIQVIKKAMRSWAKYGNVQFAYQGETTNRATNVNDGIVTISYLNRNDFNDVCGTGYVGCASSIWDFNKIIYDGYIALNPTYYNRISKIGLQGLITHEIGHLLGLNHSDDKNSIMYASPYHSNRYQSILRQDDINAIKSLYPYPTKWLTGTYENETNESRILSIDNANSLKVKITGITEKNYDYISFFDMRGNKIKSFSGVINQEFIIKDSYIKAVLTSDESIRKSGVEISISSYRNL